MQSSQDIEKIKKLRRNNYIYFKNCDIPGVDYVFLMTMRMKESQATDFAGPAIQYRLYLKDDDAVNLFKEALTRQNLVVIPPPVANDYLNEICYFEYSFVPGSHQRFFDCYVDLNNLGKLADFIHVVHDTFSFKKDMKAQDKFAEIRSYKEFISELNLPESSFVVSHKEAQDLTEKILNILETEGVDRAIIHAESLFPERRDFVRMMLGDILHEQGWNEEAIKCYELITEASIFFKQANFKIGGIYYNIASSRFDNPRDHAAKAMPYYFRALDYGDAPEMRKKLFDCLCCNSYQLGYITRVPYPEGANLDSIFELSEFIFQLINKAEKKQEYIEETHMKKEQKKAKEKVWNPGMYSLEVTKIQPKASGNIQLSKISPSNTGK